MRIASPCAGLTLLVVCTGWLAGEARADANIDGLWSGSYSCGSGGKSKLKLEVAEEQGKLSATFSFDAQGTTGSYKLTGRLRPDNSFTLAPRQWIERPTGFTALAMEGALNPNGRMIEGRVSPCLSGAFTATRTVAEGEAPPAEAPPSPLAAGKLTGIWQGWVGCRQNRRGNTENYPVKLQAYSDGDSIGAYGTIGIYKQRNSGAGPTFDQRVVLSGKHEGGTISLRSTVLDSGGARVQLRSVAGSVANDSAIEGEVRMNGCETISLSRRGGVRPLDIPPAIAGIWAGAVGRGEQTVVVLHAVNDAAAPFFELRATYPADKPEAQRDRLALSLVAVAQPGDGLLLVPVSAREATGIFSGEGTLRHFLTQSQAALVSLGADGSLVFKGIANERDFADAAGNRNAFQLARPSKGQGEALASGETPPVDFGGVIAGALAEAPSREAQCRVLAEWLKPFEPNVNIKRMSVDAVMAGLSTAFDEPFEPVFGIPFFETSQEERRAVAMMIRGTCRNMEMELVSFVGDFVLMTNHQFAQFNTLKADRQETMEWMAQSQEELDALPEDAASLKRIAALRQETRIRSRDMRDPERKQAEAALSKREMEITLAMLIAQIEAIPEGSFEQGGLNGVFALLERSRKSELDETSRGELAARGRLRASAILERPLKDAAEVAESLPISLEGLSEGHGAMRPFLAYRQPMDRWFGSIDPSGTLGPLYRRLDEIRGDAAVQAAFREALLKEAEGTDAVQRVRAKAGNYVDLGDLQRYPEFAAILTDVELVAEVRAVNIVDLSQNRQRGEPEAEEIAKFALQRVREANATFAAKEDMCMSSGFTNSIEALSCLSVPGIMTGQKGFGARLIEVRKIGCETEIPDTQYLCSFTQEIEMNMPGGEAFGGNTMTDMVREMSKGEAVDARFVRAKGGGWSVITGDLR